MLKEIRQKYEKKYEKTPKPKYLQYINEIKRLLTIEGLEIEKEYQFNVIFKYGESKIHWKYGKTNQINTSIGWINVNPNQFKKYLRYITHPKKITFGKYKNKTLGYIRGNDFNYHKWCVKNIKDFDKPFKG